MRSFLIALQFLTTVPVRISSLPSAQQVGRSLVWHPLVGLLLGLVLWMASIVMQDVAPALQAALLLTVWVGLTGALHLDGLADSADAWLGGFGDRERTLAIMKDPRSGPAAVVVLVLALLLKLVALWTLLQDDAPLALVLAPVLGRAAVALLFLATPYVRPGGLGQALAEHLPQRYVAGTLLLVAIGCLLAGEAGWLALALGLGVTLLARRSMCSRLGGTTGDTAGALLELVECAVLVGLALRV